MDFKVAQFEIWHKTKLANKVTIAVRRKYELFIDLYMVRGVSVQFIAAIAYWKVFFGNFHAFLVDENWQS